MKIYNIDVEATELNGTQTWEVKANSPEEAIEKYKKGESEFVCSDIEVTVSRTPDLDEVYEVDPPMIDAENKGDR